MGVLYAHHHPKKQPNITHLLGAYTAHYIPITHETAKNA